MFYSNFVSKILDIRLRKICCDLQIRVIGHPRSSEPTRIDIHLWLPINVTHQPWDYLVLFPRWTAISVENRQFFRLPCIQRPRWRGYPWNWVPALLVKKLEWWGYRAEQEVWRIFSRVDTIHQWRTDRRTDRHRAIAKTALTHSVARVIIQDTKGLFFPADLRMFARTIWPRTIKFSMDVSQVRVSEVSHAPIPRGRGPAYPNFGTSCVLNTAWHTTNKQLFHGDQTIRLDNSKNFTGSTTLLTCQTILWQECWR